MAENNELMVAENTTNYATGNDNICTVNLNDEAGIVKVANALSAAEPLKDHMNEWLIVTDIVTMDGQRAVSKTPCTNTYLILADGTALFSQSEGVAKAARLNAALRPNGFGAGVKIMCKEVALASGNTMKTLVTGLIEG